MTTRAVSENWLTETCRGLTASLERLRVDRQLEEALTTNVAVVLIKATANGTPPPCIALNIAKHGIRLCHPSQCSARLTCSDRRFRPR
jgi:hypothetical protein